MIKKLETGRENAYLSQKLATIITDLDVPVDLEMARPDHFNPGTVRELFRELEFRSLLPRLEGLAHKYGKSAPATSQAGQQLSLFGGEAAAAPDVPGTMRQLVTK